MTTYWADNFWLGCKIAIAFILVAVSMPFVALGALGQWLSLKLLDAADAIRNR